MKPLPRELADTPQKGSEWTPGQPFSCGLTSHWVTQEPWPTLSLPRPTAHPSRVRTLCPLYTTRRSLSGCFQDSCSAGAGTAGCRALSPPPATQDPGSCHGGGTGPGSLPAPAPASLRPRASPVSPRPPSHSPARTQRPQTLRWCRRRSHVRHPAGSRWAHAATGHLLVAAASDSSRTFCRDSLT